MADAWIDDVQLVLPGEGVRRTAVMLSAGKIARIAETSDTPGPDVHRFNGQGRLLTPGLVDLHTHGVGKHLYERSAQDLIDGAKLLPRFGTTCVLPTLYRVMNRDSLRHLEELSGALDQAVGARMPGFHLEGPFLALAGAGAQTLAGDVGLLKELLAACTGRVLAMSVSPDTSNIIPVIEHLAERSIAAFITHTRATAEQTQAAIDAGARHATHFYDVFPPPPETEPGVRPVGAVEALLADSRVSVDFICDGVHVSPFAIRAALAAKSYRGVALITDSNIGAGLDAGEYDTPWGFRVRVTPGDAARIANPDHPSRGLLAGSALTMDQGMRNLTQWLQLPPEQLWAMGTSNPARIVGLTDFGQIRIGAAADLVLWDKSLQPAITWVGGEIVFDAADHQERSTVQREGVLQ